MKILSAKQTREADFYTMQHEPISSADLMERAATVCNQWIVNKYTTDYEFAVFAGQGNNGGDGLVIARLLANLGYKVQVFILHMHDNFSDELKLNHNRLLEQNLVSIKMIASVNDFTELSSDTIVIDSLFGSGLSRKLEGVPADLVRHINACKCEIISIDIPSGLFSEDNTTLNLSTHQPESIEIIRASYTLSLQLPSLSFFFAETDSFVGEIVVLDIGLHPDGIEKAATPYSLLTEQIVKESLPKRAKFSHKGTFGHALLMAGSYGKTGAATLAALATMRSGTGLLTVYIPKSAYEILQIKVPEAMLITDAHDKRITAMPDILKYNAIGIGPGLGTETQTAECVYQLISSATMPLVLDADAINILGLHPHWLHELPENAILTPHPKEFERIAGVSNGHYHRLEIQRKLSMQYKIFIALKGAHTSITCPDGRCFFNTTGNPGMATAGSGDVLTGIITALLSQSYSPEKAVLSGVFIHGLAADLAAKEKGEISLIASDIIDYLPAAFKSLL